MGYERRGNGLYYYRKVRIGGRVVSQYVGCGRVAELAEQLHGLAKLSSAMERQEREDSMEVDRELQSLLDHSAKVANDEFSAFMESAGYRRHKRGEWRKRRVGK